MSDSTLQINLSPGDIAYAEQTIPRLISIHRKNVREVLIVLDCCKPQKTKIVDPEKRFPEPQYSEKVSKIKAIVSGFQAQGLVDRVELLEHDSPIHEILWKKYLAGVVKSTHDYGGCALNSYLAGIELAKTRYVIHYDGDMLIYQKEGCDWAEEAIGLIKDNSELVAAVPRIAPPVEGKDSPNLHIGVDTISTKDGWIDHWFSTRCFLMDKEKFNKYLPLISGKLLFETVAIKILNRGYPRSPEMMFYKRIGKGGGRRLILRNEDAWLLHPERKPREYLEILPQILEFVSCGEVPEEQRGHQEINVKAWTEFIHEKLDSKSAAI